MKIAQVGLFALVAVVAARADFSYTTTRKSAQPAANANDSSSKHFLKGQKLKIDTGNSATIMDFEAQTLTHINNTQKSYTVTKFSDLGNAVKKADVDIKVDVKNTGQTKDINGFKSSETVLTMDMDSPQAAQSGMKMQMEMDTWSSPDVPGAGELRAFYEKNRDHFPWSALGSGGNASMQRAMAELQKKMAEIHGVPVLQVIRIKSPQGGAQAAQMAQAREKLEELQKQGGPAAAMAAKALASMGGGSSGAMMEITMESSGFSAAAIPDSVFAIPAGYQKSEK